LHRVLTFGSYEMYKKTLLARFPEVKPIFVYALSAVLGDLTGSGWLCPSEVIKQRMQAGMYPSTRDAVVSIWKSKGIVGFYEGYFGGVARDVPFRVAQLTSYEVSKNLYLRYKGRRLLEQSSNTGNGRATVEERLALSSVEAAACGAVCGTFSAAVTAPLDRIKTLLMTDSAAYGGSVVSCASKIFREEGIAGLMTGVVPRVVYIAPSVVIFFVAYEQVQQRLQHWK
jgi:solute carrier family 25 (mitochondrial S-adenosylmethionine transporter), member 26